MFQSPAGIFILKSNRWTNPGGDTGDSLKRLAATLTVFVIYVHVSSTRELSSSVDLSPVASSQGSLKMLVFFSFSEEEVKRRGFQTMGTSKIRLTLQLGVLK